MRAWAERCFAEIRHRLPRKQDVDPLFYACAIMLACSLILGGAPRSGFFGEVILGFLAIPLLAFSVWRLLEIDPTRQMRWALCFCLALLALPLLQLLPLPPWLWTALPHREISAETFTLLREDPPWRPLSVSPDATWVSLLSLLPPISIFVSMLLLGYRERRWLSLLFIVLGVLTAFLGLLQIAQGPASPLRFYQYRNLNEAVGFFMNRDHFAALLYVVFLLASAWAVNAAASLEAGLLRKQFDVVSSIASLGFFAILFVLLAAEAMARSRAGMGLMMIAVLGAFFLGVAERGKAAPQASSTSRKLLVAATALALILILQFALFRILERFDQNEDVGPGSRTALTADTIEAARAYMPVGSGVGSFVPVYHLFQPPEHVVANVYADTPVNDVAQAWLETGVFGLGLMAWFAFWFGRRSLEIWRGTVPPQAEAVDWSLVRAATIVIPLLAVHAFFDFLFHTLTIMAAAAFACALMIAPPAFALRAMPRRSHREPARHMPPLAIFPSPATPAVAAAKAVPKIAPPSVPKGRWGADMQWPDEWRPSGDQASSAAPKPPDEPR